MNEAVPPDTRARILEVAMELFGEKGYHATSVREIAERVGVTKAAVLYHFPGKADLIAALAEPMLVDLEATIKAVEALADDPHAAREAIFEGLLDVWLRHRYLLQLNLRDLGLTASQSVFDRFRDSMLRANLIVAGPHPDLTLDIRASQAIAMLSDPVILHADRPAHEVRTAVLDGVHRLFGDVEPSAGRGRPTVMTGNLLVMCREMHDKGFPAAKIADELGVSRATVYRHLKA
ncbi:TetR family transcriptional regulator [Amycolatopsis rhabdoformis]|uniref:TetR family transcriptional regulator n=1 Tax=Amycolatopsis rhabdoformis TaxID=1448059 RepID=A0ABZ1I617_9PSEU|nr:TetR family transcriptional regulator [Amycolatopsis rhabdoformis]WSE29812.1 TetR family transcriptional regulator [Amycolatopsis rhabdoformis]